MPPSSKTCGCYSDKMTAPDFTGPPKPKPIVRPAAGADEDPIELIDLRKSAALAGNINIQQRRNSFKARDVNEAVRKLKGINEDGNFDENYSKEVVVLDLEPSITKTLKAALEKDRPFMFQEFLSRMSDEYIEKKSINKNGTENKFFTEKEVPVEWLTNMSDKKVIQDMKQTLNNIPGFAGGLIPNLYASRTHDVLIGSKTIRKLAQKITGTRAYRYHPNRFRLTFSTGPKSFKMLTHIEGEHAATKKGIKKADISIIVPVLGEGREFFFWENSTKEDSRELLFPLYQKNTKNFMELKPGKNTTHTAALQHSKHCCIRIEPGQIILFNEYVVHDVVKKHKYLSNSMSCFLSFYNPEKDDVQTKWEEAVEKLKEAWEDNNFDDEWVLKPTSKITDWHSGYAPTIFRQVALRQVKAAQEAIMAAQEEAEDEGKSDEETRSMIQKARHAHISHIETEVLGGFQFQPGMFWPSGKETNLVNQAGMGAWLDKVKRKYLLQTRMKQEKKKYNFFNFMLEPGDLQAGLGVKKQKPKAYKDAGMDNIPPEAFDKNVAWMYDPLERYKNKPKMQYRVGLRKTFPARGAGGQRLS